MSLRNGDDAVGSLPHFLPVGPGGQSQYVATPGLHLHNIAHGLLKELGIGAQCHHQSALLNEADGTVLELTGGVGLGVDIGDLLELQGALQAQGIVHIATDEEDAIVVEILAGVVLNVVLVGEDLLHLGRQQQHLLQHGVVLLLRHGAQQTGQVQSQQIQHRQLGGIGLSGGHSNLRPRPGVEHLVRLPGDRRAHHIDDGEDSSPQPLGLPEGGHGIQSLTRLADHNDQGLVIHNGIHVPELRRQGHLHRDPQDPLQVVFPNHAHVVRGSAGHDVELVNTAQVVLCEGKVLQEHLSVPDPGEDGPAHGLRLLHDLLEHEVLVAALLCRVHLPVHVGDLLLHRLHEVVIALDAVLGQHRHLAVVHVPHLPGVADDGGDVTG